jgi:hypothetical protein
MHFINASGTGIDDESDLRIAGLKICPCSYERGDIMGKRSNINLL